MSERDSFKKIVDRSIESITIPNSVKTIGTYAFYYCSNLQSITIPSSVTSIEVGAFHSCSNLQSITIPSSVKTIGNSAFSGCGSLAEIIIPSSVTSIGDLVFSNSSGALYLKTITFNQPNGMAITLPSAGSSTGLFYCKTASNLTIYTDNETIKNYDYSKDNVTPTFYHSLLFFIFLFCIFISSFVLLLHFSSSLFFSSYP